MKDITELIDAFNEPSLITKLGKELRETFEDKDLIDTDEPFIMVKLVDTGENIYMMDIIATVANLDDKIVHSIEYKYVIMDVFTALATHTQSSKDDCYKTVKHLVSMLVHERDAIIPEEDVPKRVSKVLETLTHIESSLLVWPRTRNLHERTEYRMHHIKKYPDRVGIPMVMIPLLKDFVALIFSMCSPLKESLKDSIAVAHALEKRLPKNYCNIHPI